MNLEDLTKEYKIEFIKRRVGEGGSAFVHKVRITSTPNTLNLAEGTILALKEYKPSVMEVDGQIERIKQENTIGKSLTHPNIIKIHGAYIPPASAEKEICCLFMEWIEGQTLGSWSADLRKNCAWDKMEQVALDIILATRELHSKKIYHRDIKPENVMVRDSRAILMDIGVAEVTGDNKHTLHTKVKDFVGSVRYSSPQFIMGETFSEKDDIYSIGCTLLELFSGRPPYEDVERKPVLPIIVTQKPPPIEALRENVPAVMKIALEGCLHKDRERRPTLSELEDVLKDGGKSSYIKKEIQRRSTEQRAYKIIKMDRAQTGFYADVGHDSPELFEKYTVVRKDEPVTVPSLNSTVEPEMWIATAELKHLHEGLGYFKLRGKRWVEGEGSSIRRFAASFSEGHWEEYEDGKEPPKVGDYVLRRIS